MVSVSRQRVEGERLTHEAILEATEAVLRRYGPSKATVVDVARELGVSHGSVYRHFATKAALREAVTRRWLNRCHADLVVIVNDRATRAPERLEAWLATLFDARRSQAAADPELFSTFFLLMSQHYSAVVEEHVAVLLGQLRQVMADGVAEGTFGAVDVAEAAQAVLDATVRFHHPAHAAAWQRPGIDAEFGAVRALLLRALTSGSLAPAAAEPGRSASRGSSRADRPAACPGESAGLA